MRTAPKCLNLTRKCLLAHIEVPNTFLGNAALPQGSPRTPARCGVTPHRHPAWRIHQSARRIRMSMRTRPRRRRCPCRTLGRWKYKVAVVQVISARVLAAFTSWYADAGACVIAALNEGGDAGVVSASRGTCAADVGRDLVKQCSAIWCWREVWDTVIHAHYHPNGGAFVVESAI